MKILHKGKLLLVATALLSFSILEANPGFSRQMDMACMACHNQTMSQLNSFGRKFAASGFTMTSGNQSMIDGDTIKLGLPSALNASVLLKARYVKTVPSFDDGLDDVGLDRGNLEVFKVSKLFLGGKIAENVGGYMYFMYDNFGGKINFVNELGSGYAGITLYMNEDFGPFAGMEYYNTGLYAPLKLFESRKLTNAAQATELGHGPATGIQAYYGGDELQLMVGAYVPATSQEQGLDSGTNGINIARITYAPTIANWTIMLGAYILDGTGRISDDALDNNKPSAVTSELIDITREAYGFDVQIEGKIADMSTVLVLQNVLHNKTELYNTTSDTPYDELTYANSGLEYKAGDNRAFSAELQVNPWEPFGIKLAYLTYDDMYNYEYSGTSTRQLIDKQDREDYSLGLDYSFRQNVRFAFEYTYSDVKINDRTNPAGDKIVSLPDSDTFLFYAMIGF